MFGYEQIPQQQGEVLNFDAFFTPEMAKPRFGDQVIDMNDNPLLNPTNLDVQLANIANLDDQLLLNVISCNLKTIIDDMTGGASKYIVLLLNERFIQVFTRAINNIYKVTPTLDYSIKSGINKIVYNFMYSPYASDDKFVSIREFMLNLGRITNKDTTPMLMAKGFNEDISTMLALTRYSTEDEMVNVHRLNNLILQYPVEIMTTQNIMNIYLSLFSSLTVVLEGSMFNLQDTAMVLNNDENKVEIYGRISLAILLLLEDMTLENIKSVLSSYSGDYTLLHSGENVRFSFRSISADFPRINSVVAIMVHQEGVLVP